MFLYVCGLSSWSLITKVELNVLYVSWVPKSISVTSLLSAVSTGVLMFNPVSLIWLFDNNPTEEQVPRLRSSLVVDFKFWWFFLLLEFFYLSLMKELRRDFKLASFFNDWSLYFEASSLAFSVNPKSSLLTLFCFDVE